MLTDADIAAAPAERARRRRRGGHGRDDDLHLRHDRQAEGRGPAGAAGSGASRRPAEPVRLPARRRLHHLRPAVPQRPQRVHGRRHALRPDGRRPAQVRRRGLAAAGGQVQGELDVLRARADPDDLRAARGGQGPLRPLVHARHDRQRGAVELRAQAAVRGGLPARVAVRGVRVDRARRGHRAAARGPDAQAGIVRQAGARHRDRAARRRRQRGHRHRPGPRRRGVRPVQGRVRHLLQERRQLRVEQPRRLPHGRRRRLLGRRGLPVHLRPQDRHDHLRRHEHLPGRDRGGAGAASRDLRRRGVRDPVRGVGRGRARHGRPRHRNRRCPRRRSPRSRASTWPATRCPGRWTSWTSCRAPARASSSSASSGRPTGPAGPPRSARARRR